MTQLTGVGQIALHVADIGDAERFYRDVLALPHLYTFGQLAFFDCGGTRLYLQAAPAGEWKPGSIVYFTVGDVHAAYERLTAKGLGFEAAPQLIHRHEDGTEEWMAFFRDPAGSILALMSQSPPTDSDG